MKNDYKSMIIISNTHNRGHFTIKTKTTSFNSDISQLKPFKLWPLYCYTNFTAGRIYSYYCNTRTS